MRSGRGGGPLFTSVSSSPEKSRTAQIMDFLSRRDFIYLVVLLAILGHLDWFLYAGAVGTPVFAGVLLGLMIKEKLRADVR
jgi:glycerol-3-phosphate acyltransferase PlsY